MVKRPTIADLAEAAGVSVATVDRVLNQRLPVREETTLLVVTAAEAIGYHATTLLKRRMTEVPLRRFGFLLQKRHDAFYQAFGEELGKATVANQQVRGKAVIEFSEELVPQTIVTRLMDLAKRCDAVAVVAVDHPLVNEAIETLSKQGKPIFTLISELSSTARTGHVGMDGRKIGRTAAWMISRAAKKPGKIGILVGSHRYLNQELAEISFRSYMREHASDFTLLEPIINLDDAKLAYDAISDMVKNNADMAGIYVCGGGQEGLIKALREHHVSKDVVVVCNELTTGTRAALIDGTVDLVLSHPMAGMAARLVEMMVRACNSAELPHLPPVLVPADIHMSENI